MRGQPLNDTARRGERSRAITSYGLVVPPRLRFRAARPGIPLAERLTQLVQVGRHDRVRPDIQAPPRAILSLPLQVAMYGKAA